MGSISLKIKKLGGLSVIYSSVVSGGKFVKDLAGNENKSRKQAPRKRSVTSITLGWLADKLRRCEEIKSQLASGTYHVDSEKVASSIIEKDS